MISSPLIILFITMLGHYSQAGEQGLEQAADDESLPQYSATLQVSSSASQQEMETRLIDEMQELKNNIDSVGPPLASAPLEYHPEENDGIIDQDQQDDESSPASTEIANAETGDGDGEGVEQEVGPEAEDQHVALAQNESENRSLDNQNPNDLNNKVEMGQNQLQRNEIQTPLGQPSELKAKGELPAPVSDQIQSGQSAIKRHSPLFKSNEEDETQLFQFPSTPRSTQKQTSPRLRSLR